MIESTEKLQQLSLLVNNCLACKLATTRKHVVFGEGNPAAGLMFIGEGPGRQEDETGRPFVGRSGELLNRLIAKHLGLARKEVYIANIVKCRPTRNLLGLKDRAPDPEETAACSHWLQQQIAIISPRVIVTLGGPSSKFILQNKTGITRLRGHWGLYQNIPVMPTFHPSFLLRNGGEGGLYQQEIASDLAQVRQKLQPFSN